MKEFVPVNQDRLTTPARPSKLERRGDIFMAEGTGVPEQTPSTPNEVADHLASMKSQRQGSLQTPIEAEEHLRKLKNRAQGATSHPEPERASELGAAEVDEVVSENSEEGVGRGEILKKLYSSILNKPEIIAQLKSTTPDFSSASGLKRFIETLNPTDEAIVHFADYITNSDTRLIDAGTNQPVEITLEARKLLFEWVLEKIIGLPDKGSPEAKYEVGSFRAQENVTSLKSLSVSNFEEEDPEFAKYIGELIEMRAVAHEFRRSLALGESYKNIIQEHLKSHGLDFMRNTMAGVGNVVSQYEIIAGLKVAEKHKWFDEEDVRNIDKEVRETIIEAQSQGLITDKGRKLMAWEVERALNIGKTLFAGTQRYAMYASLGDLPPETAARIGSLPYEYITRTIAPFKVIASRFFGGGGAPRAFIGRYLANLKGKENGTTNHVDTLFGISEDAWITNGIGSPDPESHSWRSQLMFYGDIGIKIGTEQNPQMITLLQYLDSRWKDVLSNPDYKGQITTSELLGYSVPPALEDKVRKEICADPDVVKAIVGQRLYLSSLIRNEYLTPVVKQALIKKIAILDPLKMTALDPNIINNLSEGERQLWNGMRQRLLLGGVKRLQQDGKRYRNDKGELVHQSRSDLNAEADRYIEFTDGVAKLRILSVDDAYDIAKEYYDFSNMEEIDVLKKVIGLGIDSKTVEKVAGIRMPFTFMIDDAPHVAWAKTGYGEAGLGDENVFRLLLSDQNNLNEGYGALSSLAENPNRDFAKNISTFVEKVGMVKGRVHAQKEAKPIIISWTEMVSMFRSSKFIGGLQRILQMPTSEMEKYYSKSGSSLDERQREVALDSFAQQGAINSSVALGESELQEIKKKTHSDRMDVFKRNARIILLLLGPVIGGELIKILFPADIAKSFGGK